MISNPNIPVYAPGIVWVGLLRLHAYIYIYKHKNKASTVFTAESSMTITLIALMTLYDNSLCIYLVSAGVRFSLSRLFWRVRVTHDTISSVLYLFIAAPTYT